MRKSLLTVIFILFSFAVFSQIQSNVFKKTQRQTKDTTKLNFTPIYINGAKNNLKSSKKQQTISYLNSIPNSDNTTKVKYSNTSKLPVFIERNTKKTKSFKTRSERCYEFLTDVKSYTGISKPNENFFISYEQTDELGQTHIRMNQKYKGIEVYGSDFYIHLKNDKEQLTGNFHLIKNTVDTIAKIPETKAIEIVNSNIKNHTSVTQLSDKQKKILEYEKPQIKLVIKSVEGKLESYKLMYQINIRPNFIEEWIYFIDASDGSIVKYYNNTKKDGPTTATALDLNNVSRTINTTLDAGTYYLADISQTMYNATTNDGIILTYNANNTSPGNSNFSYSPITSTNNTWTNKTAVSAHYNALSTYLYFKNTFNRNSINGKGGNILSFINITDQDESNLDNAYWNGKFISYGNGSTMFKPLAGGLDVAAHEIGHGIVSSTANLEYQGQSGAMNESFADIFGAMVDRDDWYIGEDITTTSYITTGRLRDMSNPHNDNANGWQPMHTSEIYIGTEDDGGVHINSGIVNYAYYLYATAITKEKTEQVYYRALTNYLTSSSQFIDLRIAVVNSAIDLYGDGSNEVLSAKIAFDAVGIYDEAGNNYLQDYAANPGTQYLCYYDLVPAHPSTFYASDIVGNNPVGLTNKYANSRMSFTDNGLYGVYVSSTKTIRLVNTNTLADAELQNQPIWKNAIISKDGNHLAAITDVSDTAIWVYDFTISKWAKFQLYNPTTSSGNNNSGGVLFSDAIEFDVTGESITYDAYNVINSNSGTDINYWDIGIINVWNNQTNNFGDGTIMKLYGSLPEKVSIGNPTFSKNSPYIIAFDYLNESTNQFAIIGSNIVTGEVDIISLNDDIGYPSYTKDDDVLVFTSTNGADAAVKGIILEPNKISTSSSNSPILLVDNAKWGVCFATGKRDLGLPPIANFTASYKSGNTPLSVQFLDLSVNDPVAWFWSFEGGNSPTSTLQNPTVTYSTAGTYKVTLKATNSFGNNTVTKTSFIKVIQSSLSVSPSSLTIAAPANSTKTFDITSNTSWNISINQTWLTANTTSETNNAKITLTASANLSTSTRTATIMITGTGVTPKTVTVTQDVGTTDLEVITKNNFCIFPNPAQDLINIICKENSTLTIFDLQGNQIMTKVLTNAKNTIMINNLPAGIYTIKVASKNNLTTQKIIKE